MYFWIKGNKWFLFREWFFIRIYFFVYYVFYFYLIIKWFCWSKYNGRKRFILKEFLIINCCWFVYLFVIYNIINIGFYYGLCIEVVVLKNGIWKRLDFIIIIMKWVCINVLRVFFCIFYSLCVLICNVY